MSLPSSQKYHLMKLLITSYIRFISRTHHHPSPAAVPSNVSSPELFKVQFSPSMDNYYKQIDGCGMGNPLSPVIANIFMSKLEQDVVTPQAPPFYDRYVDDCFTKRTKNTDDHLLQSLNSYHPNITFTVEENPTHFLNTKLSHNDSSFITSVYKKPGKLQIH